MDMAVKFKEAQFYRQLADKKVHCILCPHSCFIENGERGKCKARQNIDGRLKSLNYAKLYVASCFPIEQNSLFHALPGKESLNISALGNNLDCNFNHKVKEYNENMPIIEQTPAQVINQAKKTKSETISYIGEPVTYYEYLYDIASKGADLKHFIFTNGFINEDSIIKLSKLINGGVFEIKSMDNNFYDKFCNAKLESVLKTIKTAYEHGLWVELKILIMPYSMNDFYEIRKFVSWALNNLSSNIPLHMIAVQQNDKTTSSPEITFEQMKKARKIAIDAGMNFVYTDNIELKEGRTTFCPKCKRAVIIRGNDYIENYLKEGKCRCGTNIPGIWK